MQLNENCSALNEKMISLLVLSCDLYEDVWDPYFKLIQKNWPDHPQNCYLMTEEKQYNCSFMPVKTICTGKGVVWSERLKTTLKAIDSKYVLFSLEDYFVHAPVDSEAFTDAVAQMEANPEWGGIWFHPIRRGISYPERYNRDQAYLKTKWSRNGRTNMMIILYRKEYLERLIVQPEDAWAFESNSNVRSIVAGKEVIHYRINHSAPIFRYYNKFIDGVGITSRKWLHRTHEIFELNGIADVNFENLGVLNGEMAYQDPTDKRTNKSSVKISLRDWVYYYIKRPIKKTQVALFIRACIYWIKFYR